MSLTLASDFLLFIRGSASQIQARPPNLVCEFAQFMTACMQVIMSNKEAAERACKEPNPIIDGRKANVNLAILGAKPRGNLTGDSGTAGHKSLQ